MSKEFDAQTKRAGIIHLDAKIGTLNDLLSDIKDHGFTETYQIEGHINNLLEIMNELKGNEYEADAKADHLTGQIPNV